MLWTTTDSKGKQVTWYSENVINEIKAICKHYGLVHIKNDAGQIIATEGNPVTAKILRIIESEEKCEIDSN